MAHTHPVVDSDSRFVINSTTREISTTSDKLELIQGDHQSERITFEIPKIVEGHDMSLSDRIEVHYINIDRRTNATSRDVYIIDDASVDGDKLTFSWLISGNATKYYGRLNFIILFECLDPDGNYTYKWNTEICKLLTIGEGISNTSAVIEDHSDILEKFKKEILEEAGENSIQPDWNQNDETQPDYVKNRPFYTGDPVETVLVEESTVPFEDDGGVYITELESTFSATVGEAYKVSWDGTVYESACVDFHGRAIIGNLSIIGEGSDTGEPFVMIVTNGLGLAIGTKDTSASHTFSISGVVQEVVKIDPKYIRDMYYTGDPVETVLVKESTVSFTKNPSRPGVYMAQFKSQFEATVGETYKVSWDGTVYECACVLIQGLPAIGNSAIMGPGSDTGVPFLMGVNNGKGIQIITADTSASHTFSISGFVSEVVKIDEKYLPENLATKSDIDEKLGNCIKTVNGTAPDASGNVEVQTISEDALSTNQYGTMIIVKSGVVFKNRLAKYAQMPIGESNVAFLVQEGKTSNARDTVFAFASAPDTRNGMSNDQIRLSRNGIDFNSENVIIRSFKQADISVDVIQLNSSRSHGVMVEITKDACFVLPSSTSGSTKKFKITVDDSGTISATEVT